MSQRGQVCTDLVCASRPWARFEQSPGLFPFKHLESCFRGFAPFKIDRGAVFVSHVYTQRVFCYVFIPIGIAVYYRVINLLNFMEFKLTVERTMCFRCARENHDAAGDLVQAMDNPYLLIFLFEHFQQIGRVCFPAIG